MYCAIESLLQDCHFEAHPFNSSNLQKDLNSTPCRAAHKINNEDTKQITGHNAMAVWTPTPF